MKLLKISTPYTNRGGGGGGPVPFGPPPPTPMEKATEQRTRPRAVLGAPRRAAWQLKSILRHSVSAAPRTIIFYLFFTIIASELFLYVHGPTMVSHDATII